ncbi:hypothetical protein [Gymnodinialimonas hymeniacidonis]|uniref:hypothetical protein n=1 Tax=Gymnodinialimonas hymeniacidonis TaxID=3126508 RepID=UPI0034C5B308
MPLRNRVLPTGQIVADPARGTLTGNRGILVDRDGRMTNRQWALKAWITCVLEFRGRRRPVAQPRTWTELFFLDEAVAFSAGHRPCAYCRRADYNQFKAHWGGLKAGEMDQILHGERLNGREKRLHSVRLQDMPDGAFVLQDERPMLVMGDALLPYTPNGYRPPKPRMDGPAEALTPPSLIEILRHGYRPKLHLTAAPAPLG